MTQNNALQHLFQLFRKRSYLLALIPDFDEAAIGAGLGDLEVSLSAGGDAVVVEAALLGLVQQRALAGGAQGRSAARRCAAPAAGARRHATGGRAGLAPWGLGGQVQPVGCMVVLILLYF